MFSMKNLTIGQRLYLSVMLIFLLFAVAFIIFQQQREKQYRLDALNNRLQYYNNAIENHLEHMGPFSVQTVKDYLSQHSHSNIRVTFIAKDGTVLYDNKVKNYSAMPNHKDKEEVKAALYSINGASSERQSFTFQTEYFYSATYFPHRGYIIRSSLPYDNDLAQSLKADQHYIWFAITAIVILTFVLYRFTSRLGANITKLRIFAYRADHNESVETEDLVAFPDDELGEIAERIIKIYKKLQSTRKEQDILKKQLTQNIAHELKTPVASIQGYLETIIENPQMNDATRHQFLQRCYAQTQRLTSLLQDISTLNRIEDAPTMTSMEAVNISQTVANIVKETALQIQQKRMTFINKLPPDIIIKGNPSLLYSVFRNLTDNAIAYAGENTTITLSATEDKDEWDFIFSDNGVGVPSEHLPRLFERFYRVDKGRSRKMGGTGLGLAIVKNAVIIHGGTISVRNNFSGGLRFTFSLKKNNQPQKQEETNEDSTSNPITRS